MSTLSKLFTIEFDANTLSSFLLISKVAMGFEIRSTIFDFFAEFIAMSSLYDSITSERLSISFMPTLSSTSDFERSAPMLSIVFASFEVFDEIEATTMIETRTETSVAVAMMITERLFTTVDCLVI